MWSCLNQDKEDDRINRMRVCYPPNPDSDKPTKASCKSFNLVNPDSNTHYPDNLSETVKRLPIFVFVNVKCNLKTIAIFLLGIK